MKQKKNILKVNNISKSFIVPSEKKESIKSYFVNPFHRVGKRKFEVLKDINLSVKRGEFLGIIGRNGSGKSTLLKILAGIYKADKGSIEINGKIVPFLELGVGFNPELSGRENIFLNGTILGMSRKFLDKKFEDIVDFAEIWEFIDLPLKNYSSGMQVRLAFSIAIQSDADLYLIDEVLAVGDVSFQEKCFDVFRRIKKEGKSLILVSHSQESIELFCDRAIWIEHGEKRFDGTPKDVFYEYIKENYKKDQTKQGKDIIADNYIKNVTIQGKKKDNTAVVRSDEDITFDIEVEVKNPELDMYVGFAIHDKHTNAWICGNNSYFDKFKAKWKHKSNHIQLTFPKGLFNKGIFVYYVSLFVGRPSNNDILHMYSSMERNKTFKVISKSMKNGLLHIPHIWKQVP